MSAVPRTSSKPSTSSTPSTTQSNLKVVKLTPPTFQNVSFTQTGDVQAQKGHIKRTYVCLRPNHKALPRIEAETIQDQTIIHNYGHGGSGWTLLFGTVEKAIKEFTTVAAQKLLPLDTKIVIVGAGCIGLTTAIYLNEKGYTNVEVVAEKLNDIASYNAGGLFGIVSLNLESEVAQRDCEYLILQTYRRYADIANGKDAIFNNGVQKVWSYTGNEANVGPMFTNMGLDLLINYGVIPKGEEVLVDFGKNKFKMIRYETFYVYPTAFMADLNKQCKERGIKIQQGKVNNFSDVKASIVFNCTGLGARELAKDPEMHPVAGHMIELQGQPDIKEINYIIKTKFAMTPVTTPEEVAKLPTLYYMPKAEGVIGGTFVKNDNGDNVEANAKEYRGLIERSRALFGYTPKPAL